MTSFELFRLLEFNKNLYFIYSYFFLLRQIKCVELHHFMKKIIYFASIYGRISDIKIKLCK